MVSGVPGSQRAVEGNDDDIRHFASDVEELISAESRPALTLGEIDQAVEGDLQGRQANGSGEYPNRRGMNQ